MQNDLTKELGTNFIEYAVAVNTDRAIPNAKDGLKPVAKRILWGAEDKTKCIWWYGMQKNEYKIYAKYYWAGYSIRISRINAKNNNYIK